jgi:hypothetical protein
MAEILLFTLEPLQSPTSVVRTGNITTSIKMAEILLFTLEPLDSNSVGRTGDITASIERWLKSCCLP